MWAQIRPRKHGYRIPGCIATELLSDKPEAKVAGIPRGFNGFGVGAERMRASGPCVHASSHAGAGIVETVPRLVVTLV